MTQQENNQILRQFKAVERNCRRLEEMADRGDTDELHEGDEYLRGIRLQISQFLQDVRGPVGGLLYLRTFPVEI
jgi:hypothetical protein